MKPPVTTKFVYRIIQLSSIDKPQTFDTKKQIFRSHRHLFHDKAMIEVDSSNESHTEEDENEENKVDSNRD